MKRILSFLLAALLTMPAGAHFFDPDPRGPVIQIALLLDTSNSMDGLIGQAKSQLWRVVNDLASCRRRGAAPRVEVALYEYGNSSLAAGENYLRQVLPFTRDLDRVADRLFGLVTNGGEEYCGAVIKDAARNLAWDDRSSTYKAVFIAGNEPFTQGGVDFRSAVSGAVNRGIVVNTIFCGDRREGVQTRWKEGADRGRGAFLTINQDEAPMVMRTPYDDEIERLGSAMNETYVSYGDAGRASEDRRARADKEAFAAAPAGAAVERSLFKSKAQYNEASSGGDAVTGVAMGSLSVGAMQKQNLPAAYQAMDDKELEKTLKAKAADREKIQKDLDRLGKLRAEHLAKQSAGAKSTLDAAVIEAVRAQAASQGYTFEKE